MGTVPVRYLRMKSANVIARVARGESLTVTRAGEAVATVTPLRRRSGAPAELIKRRRTLPRVDAEALRADIDALIR